MKEIQTATGQIGNYLSRIRPQYERRRFERRKCNFLARLLFTLKGCRNITQYIVGVEDISEVGVRVATDHGKDIPRFFYLFVGKYQHGIGCFVVGREKGILRCEFIREEQTRMVDFLAGITNANSTLGELKHPLFFPGDHH